MLKGTGKHISLIIFPHIRTALGRLGYISPTFYLSFSLRILIPKILLSFLRFHVLYYLYKVKTSQNIVKDEDESL